MGYNTTQKQAMAAGKKLANRCGEGYEPVIWNNLGWHYCARKGAITVRESIVLNPEHEGYPAYYRAQIEPGESFGFSGGSMNLSVQIFVLGETPKEAIAAVLEARDADCAKIEEIVATLRNIE